MNKLRDLICTIILIILATIVAHWFYNTTENMANMATVYMLAVVLISRYTNGYLWGILGSIGGVIGVNYFFTYPYFEVDFTRSGYPLTFIGMLAISFVTSATTTHMKEQRKLAEFREEMNKKLYETQKRLEIETEKEKMRANLLRAVSHDLRTPLTSMIGSSDLYLEAKDTLKEIDKTQLIRNIKDDANWLLNMVENLLAVTRIKDGGAKVNKLPQPIEEVVSEAVMRLKKRYPDAKIRIKIPDDFLMVRMDALLIEQVMINLLENAIKYAHSNKPMDLIVTKETKDVKFAVLDYGVGISKEKRESIFEGNGISQNNESDSSKGMGVGLSICKSIILAHGGTIEADNHEQGAIFTFTLPLNEGEQSNE